MNIEINDFTGPLDLLLHLIKTNKMDIYNINIELITKEYIKFINENKKLSIDICSEYLVMASELIHIKSKLLLNKKIDEEDELYEINTKDELQERLLEYQNIKNMSEDFRLLEDKRSNVFTKLPENLSEYRKNEQIVTDITLVDLLSAFEQFLKRQKIKEPIERTITKKELSVDDRSNDIRNIIKTKGRINFIDLFDCISKPYVIVTFLSILDLAKKNEIIITQENNFSEIIIEGSTR